MTITRRAAIALGGTAVVTGAAALAFRRSGPEEISPREREGVDRLATNFMQQFGVPGMSVTIAQNGRDVYQQPYGLANRDTAEPVSIANLFRIASVSKPLTSAAIFWLVERGKLRLDDTVFGKEGILGQRYGTLPYNSYVESVTVDHLLTHTGGGWDNGPGDPMFLSPTLSQADLISWTIDNRPLENPPGTHWAYSNFGYCLLGRVIEAITGRGYAEFMESGILAPCGIDGMQIAGNTLEERAPNEVTYYGQSDENPYDMNLQRMDSHGGWLATPSDLVRFASRLESLLRPETIRTMTTACAANSNYARGWAVNAQGNWWHNGSLPGTSTILVRTHTGFCWAALANTRRQPSAEMDTALDNVVWNMLRQVPEWHAR